MGELNAVGHGCLTLVLGGARSGKSRHAQTLAMAIPPPWVYVATAEALDDEMQERIAKHRSSRADGWTTIEEPIELARAVVQAPARSRGTKPDTTASSRRTTSPAYGRRPPHPVAQGAGFDRREGEA